MAQSEMKIYDRWGTLVFSSASAETGWDGRYKGTDCQVGVYFFIAEITFKNGETLIKKGNVTLVR